jgi:hypothetical protein
VKQCPETPPLDTADGFTGHVWVQELPTGGTFRFQVAASGLVTFATPERSFDTVTAVPAPFRRAATTISDRLDLDALQAATDDPERVTFCGIATRNEGVDYDWDSVPAFVGVDVWSQRQGQFLAPDTATSVFERLELPTLPTIETEVVAAHTDLARFHDETEFPASEWRAGSAAGVLIRDKSGGRGAAWAVDRAVTDPETEPRSAPALAERYATPARIDGTVAALQAEEAPLTVDSIRDRLIADLARESYVDLFPDGAFVASMAEFRSLVAERVQEHWASR